MTDQNNGGYLVSAATMRYLKSCHAALRRVITEHTATVEIADRMAAALKDAAAYYMLRGQRVCGRCGQGDRHTDWCPTPGWEALIAEYTALAERLEKESNGPETESR